MLRLPICLVAVLAVFPVGDGSHAGSAGADVASGCFFEADFLAKRIAGESREARAAEARRWYVRRLVRDALDTHRWAANMTPVPSNFRGS
jgi:hypothetical protein